jgi:hypothetical protein
MSVAERNSRNRGIPPPPGLLESAAYAGERAKIFHFKELRGKIFRIKDLALRQSRLEPLFAARFYIIKTFIDDMT